MKKCIECSTQVPDLAHTCPNCGGGSFIQVATAEDALSRLDSMRDQTRAAQHVDRSAELFKAGRLEEAKRELEAALRINPLNPTAHGNMGAVLLEQGRPEEAIPWLEKALALNPKLEGATQALAKAQSAANDLLTVRQCEKCKKDGRGKSYNFHYSL
jgi:tetratricopeptide (TPR) repeat protein